jgi:hypothetical protein
MSVITVYFGSSQLWLVVRLFLNEYGYHELLRIDCASPLLRSAIVIGK